MQRRGKRRTLEESDVDIRDSGRDQRRPLNLSTGGITRKTTDRDGDR